MSTRMKLHFARFEFKYVLPQGLRNELERELRYFLEFDPYVATHPEHRYFVRSLYFDDPFYTSFYDKVDGLFSRYKFRVRTYTENPLDDTPLFLEMKGRHNNLVLKHRVMLKGGDAGIKTKGEEFAAWTLNQTSDGTLRSHYGYELFRKRLRPVALIDYYRRPYVSKFDPEFRLTFDSHLTSTAAQGILPAADDRYRKIAPGYTVLEVKFRRHIPSWFHRIIQSYELRAVPFSKICHGLVRLGAVSDQV